MSECVIVRSAGVIVRSAGVIVRSAGVIVSGVIVRPAGVIVRSAGVIVRSDSRDRSRGWRGRLSRFLHHNLLDHHCEHICKHINVDTSDWRIICVIRFVRFIRVIG